MPQTCRISCRSLYCGSVMLCFLFCNGFPALLPFQLLLFTSATHQNRRIRCRQRSMAILCFWPAAPGTFGLAPAYPHTPVSIGTPCLFLGRLWKFPLCKAHYFLVKISLLDLTDYRSLCCDCSFPVPCPSPCHWTHYVIGYVQAMCRLCNRLLLVAHCGSQEVWQRCEWTCVQKHYRYPHSNFTPH